MNHLIGKLNVRGGRGRKMLLLLFLLFLLLLPSPCAPIQPPPLLRGVDLLDPFYMHGAGFGAAAEMLSEERFADKVFRALQPRLYSHVMAGGWSVAGKSIFASSRKKGANFGRADKRDERKLVAMFENSPVVAAFSVLEATQDAQDAAPHAPGGAFTRVRSIIEWDCFFNPRHLRAWSAARAAGKDLLAQAALLSAVETMYVAHGLLAQLATSDVQTAYDQVSALPVFNMGGVTAKRWLDRFARALVLGVRYGDYTMLAGRPSDELVREAEDTPSLETTWGMAKSVGVFRDLIFPGGVPASGIYGGPSSQTKTSPRTARASSLSGKLQRQSAISRAPGQARLAVSPPRSDPAPGFVPMPLAIVMDIKQPKDRMAADPDFDLPAFYGEIAGLFENSFGMRIEAIGTFKPFKRRFDPSQVHKYDTTVDKVHYPPPKLVKFFHFAGGFQRAIREKIVRRGDFVMFNGASLLTTRTGEGIVLDQRVLESLAIEIKRHDVKLGLYVQEPDTCLASYNAIATAVNTNPETFKLGFAWGGLNGKVANLQSETLMAAWSKGEGAQVWLKSNRFGWFVDEVAYRAQTRTEREEEERRREEEARAMEKEEAEAGPLARAGHQLLRHTDALRRDVNKQLMDNVVNPIKEDIAQHHVQPLGELL